MSDGWGHQHWLSQPDNGQDNYHRVGMIRLLYRWILLEGLKFKRWFNKKIR